MLRLLCNERSVDLQQSRRVRRARTFHGGKTPERITLIQQVIRRRARQRGPRARRRGQRGLLASGQVAFGRTGQRMDPQVIHPDRRRPAGVRAKHFHIGAAIFQGADDFLHVDRAAFPAKNRHAEVRADIGNSHRFTSVAASRKFFVSMVWPAFDGSVGAACDNSSRSWAKLLRRSKRCSTTVRARVARLSRSFLSPTSNSMLPATPSTPPAQTNI